MNNRTDSASMTVLIFITFFGFALITTFGFLGMFVAFICMTSYMDNFVLKPLAKNISVINNMPNNYMYRKLQNARLVSWFVATMLGFYGIFVVEMIAIMISFAKINELKRKMGEPITTFSKYDYQVYEEYSRFTEGEEYSSHEKEEIKNDDYKKRNNYVYNDVVDEQKVKNNTLEEYTTEKNNISDTSVVHNETEIIMKEESLEDKEEILKKEIEAIKKELYKTISVEPVLQEVKKFDFDKPVGEISNVEPIKTSTSSIWDKPVGDDSKVFEPTAQVTLEPSEDEICCEKCGMVMSKMKIACPKCGTLVKNSYKK